MENHKGLFYIGQYSEEIALFSPHIATLFRMPGQITRTGNQAHSETLFTFPYAVPTQTMILPSPVPVRPRLGVSTFGCLAHSWRAVSSSSRIEGCSKSLGSAATAKARVPLPIIRKRRSSERRWTPQPRAPSAFGSKTLRRSSLWRFAHGLRSQIYLGDRLSPGLAPEQRSKVLLIQTGRQKCTDHNVVEATGIIP